MSKATRERSNLPPLNISKPPDRVVRVGDPGSVAIVHESASVPYLAPVLLHLDERAAAVEVASRPDPVWNNLRRLWMLDGVPLDPQPAPPGGAGGGLTNRNPFTAAAVHVPPSLKVQA